MRGWRRLEPRRPRCPTTSGRTAVAGEAADGQALRLTASPSRTWVRRPKGSVCAQAGAGVLVSLEVPVEPGQRVPVADDVGQVGLLAVLVHRPAKFVVAFADRRLRREGGLAGGFAGAVGVLPEGQFARARRRARGTGGRLRSPRWSWPTVAHDHQESGPSGHVASRSAPLVVDSSSGPGRRVPLPAGTPAWDRRPPRAPRW